jgi:hypothetical protein
MTDGIIRNITSAITNFPLFGRASDQQNSNGFYNVISGGYGFVYNNRNPEVEGVLRRHRVDPDSLYIINSESLAYGLLRAVKTNDRTKFEQIMNTVYELSRRNYRETRSIKLLPWAVTIPRNATSRNDFSIVGFSDNENFGNASAADSDIDLMTAMIMGVQKGWGNNELRSFIHLYAQDFVRNVVKVFPRTPTERNPRSSFYLLNQGALIPGETDSASGRVYYKFYPTYPNFNYLKYIAEYFRNGGTNNFSGSSYLYNQFSYLHDDTREIFTQMKSQYRTDLQGENPRFPSNVMISVPLTGQLIFKNANYNQVDSLRLFWRTQDDTFIYTNAQLAALRQNNISRQDYYYSYLFEITELRNPLDTEGTRIESGFNFDDVLKHEGYINHPLHTFNTHWGISEWRPFQAFGDGYHLPGEEVTADRTPIETRSSANYRAAVSTSVLDLKIKMLHAFELMGGSTLVDKGERAAEDTLTHLVQLPTVADTHISTPGSLWFWRGVRKASDFVSKGNFISRWVTEKINQVNNIECVSRFVSSLRTMKGVSPDQLKERIDRLIAAAPNRLNANNAVLRQLYLEKVLLWNTLSPAEKDQLENEIAPAFGLQSLIAYQRYAEQVAGSEGRNYHRIQLSLEGVNIDTDTQSIYDIQCLPISSNLKGLLIGEIIKREAQSRLLALQNSTADARAEAYENIRDFIAEVPEEHRLTAITFIAYDDRLNIGERKTIILEALEKLDKDEMSQSAYLDNYLALWRAYYLVLYNETKVSRDACASVNATTEARGELVNNLSRLEEMTNIIFGEESLANERLDLSAQEQQALRPLLEQNPLPGFYKIARYKCRYDPTTHLLSVHGTMTRTELESIDQATGRRYTVALERLWRRSQPTRRPDNFEISLGETDRRIVSLFKENRENITNALYAYRDINSYEYGDLVADTATLMYWTGYGLINEVQRNNPRGFSEAHFSYMRYFRERAINLLGRYKNDNSDVNSIARYWMNQHSIFAINSRIAVEESGNAQEMFNAIRVLDEKMAEALRYNHQQSYAHLLAAKASIIISMRGAYPRARETLQEILNDPRLRKFDYIYTEVRKQVENAFRPVRPPH